MTKNQNIKPYNLEIRTLQFAKQVRLFIRTLPKTIGVIEEGKQVIRSSGSVGANYLEANEALSKKDFLMRMKISRKEAKETSYWLQLIDCEGNSDLDEKKKCLLNEIMELRKILSSIINKSE
jgi:four helix bundle protein